MAENNEKSRPPYDDEISLVDLASTFLRRRRIFYAVFLLTLLSGIVYALLMPQKYEFVSLVKLAERDVGNTIEKPALVIATLENRWLPDYRAAYNDQHEEPMPMEVQFENPENTSFIRIVSESPQAEVVFVNEIHSSLIAQLEKSQALAVSNLSQSLKAQIESLSSSIEMLRGTQDAGAAIAAAVEKRLSLESTLKSVQSMETLALGRQALEPAGPARSLIILLSGMLGLIAGVFFAFFAEFASLVRAQMNDI